MPENLRITKLYKRKLHRIYFDIFFYTVLDNTFSKCFRKKTSDYLMKSMHKITCYKSY